MCRSEIPVILSDWTVDSDTANLRVPRPLFREQISVSHYVLHIKFSHYVYLLYVPPWGRIWLNMHTRAWNSSRERAMNSYCSISISNVYRSISNTETFCFGSSFIVCYISVARIIISWPRFVDRNLNLYSSQYLEDYVIVLDLAIVLSVTHIFQYGIALELCYLFLQH